MVQIGGKKGTGIFANVNIILYGKDDTHTNKYKEHYLFTSIVKDGPCLVSKFSIKSTIDIPEVQKIELWRDNNDGSFANWYLDWIEVTNNKNGLTTIFPAMKWIKENQRYFFKNETSLPQNDPMKELRRLELQVLQEYYQLEVKIPGLPAQIKELPEDETFSSDYFVSFIIVEV
ncbi:lipoxygenase homology domain-containing protein 1-like [Mytilus trossulus]|uniref:lipoxygenase homology domain-containing protein 1-like n=1 Tax=Mytilus trossulus TaxID=6551 RepID=UPI0030054965